MWDNAIHVPASSEICFAFRDQTDTGVLSHLLYTAQVLGSMHRNSSTALLVYLTPELSSMCTVEVHWCLMFGIQVRSLRRLGCGKRRRKFAAILLGRAKGIVGKLPAVFRQSFAFG